GSAVKLPETGRLGRIGIDADLVRVRVFADIYLCHVRQRQIAHGCTPSVDDLMSDLGAASGARNDVVLANAVLLAAKAQFAFALEDKEHLFLGTMRVERALCLARWQFCQIVPK